MSCKSKLSASYTKLRKIKRYFSMKQFKIAVFFMIACSFAILILYYLYRSSPTIPTKIDQTRRPYRRPSSSLHHDYIIGTPMIHMPLDEIYKDRPQKVDDFSEETKPKLFVNTPGCQIGVIMNDYSKSLKDDKKRKRSNCERRAVFLKKIDGIHVQATINKGAMKKYLRKSPRFDCCYQFIRRSTRPGHENTKIKFSRCHKFETGSKIKLETDFINVKCFEIDARNTSRAVYDDVFAFTKRINIASPKPANTSCNDNYNVLILGMDSMSLSRTLQTLPLTVEFFHQNFWLVLKGYHKIGDNTFPNLMAVLSGYDMKTISKLCQGKMDQCNDKLMWSRFKKSGYVTAYGEDFLRLPDTFSKRYAFSKQPTDHYIRPLFLKGETEMSDKSTICAGKSSAGQQLLDYATDFVATYRNDSFFGFFWMNSFSHNTNSRPQDADRMLENFFNKITYTGILDNTFVIFFSDHGIRFGEHRATFESYYEERMPVLFMWAPTKFKGKHWMKHKAIAINQFRLVTPYDLFSTLVDIDHLSNCRELPHGVSHACPNCQSIFSRVNTSRQCRDVAIHDKWCSCHKLYPLDPQAEDTEGMKSVSLAVAYIRTLIKLTKTKKCWQCMNISLKTVIRIHFYYLKKVKNPYYVVAFTTTPGNMSYEATVKKSEIIGPISVISPYRGLGNCTTEADSRFRAYCICQRIQSCK